ncbi:MAG: pro-sigmaK processing inhibitor BofA family protein [Ezakiella sp.]|nr:pro-sigmaK processing inhibitor BofA family protein [Ezakiella sp.]MDD7471355.1 pro-sigmaK processing inhibitor BofA family protein [Bacillota bacterium]MDY3923550.1 pro-sigmaK processing inhibitor BofA family protein [Ezakiella sp.]
MYFIIGVGILLVVLLLLAVPFKIMIKLLINALAGAIVILMVNLVLSNFEIIIPLTKFNSILVGIFGVPAAILMGIYYALQ